MLFNAERSRREVKIRPEPRGGMEAVERSIEWLDGQHKLEATTTTATRSVHVIGVGALGAKEGRDRRKIRHHLHP
jgi:hypothetical protein